MLRRALKSPVLRQCMRREQRRHYRRVPGMTNWWNAVLPKGLRDKVYVWLGHCPVPRYQHFPASGVSSNLQTRHAHWSHTNGRGLPLVGGEPFSRQDRACAVHTYLWAVCYSHLERRDVKASARICYTVRIYTHNVIGLNI